MAWCKCVILMHYKLIKLPVGMENLNDYFLLFMKHTFTLTLNLITID